MRRLILYIRQSLSRKQFVTLLLALILPISALSFYIGHSLSQILINRETVSLKEKASAAQINFEKMLQEMQDLMGSLILNEDFQAALKRDMKVPTIDWFHDYLSIKGLLETLSTRSGNTYSAHVFTVSEKLYSAYNAYTQMTDQSPLIQRLSQTGYATVLINHPMEKIDSKNVITMGRMTRLTNGVHCYIWIDAAMSKLEETFAAVNEPGTMIHLSIDNETFYYSGSKPREKVQAAAQRIGQQDGAPTVTIDGDRYILIQKSGANKQYSLSLLVNYQAVFADVMHLQATYYRAMSMILILSIGVSLLHSRRIAQSICRLQRSISQFADAPLSHAEPMPTDSIDEIGKLTQNFNAMEIQIVHLLQQQKEDERQKRKLEFLALQAQITPHMIYHSLHTISYLAQLQNVSNVDEFSQSLAGLLRRVFNFRGSCISIEDELNCIRDYVHLKSYNTPWGIDCPFKVTQEAGKMSILKLLLQPLVENAYIHAFSPQYPIGKIRIQVAVEKGKVRIIIQDNGQGIAWEKLRQIMRGQPVKGGFNGLGIHNVYQRLQLEYGDSASFMISSKLGNGTAIYLSFPATLYEPSEGE